MVAGLRGVAVLLPAQLGPELLLLGAHALLRRAELLPGLHATRVREAADPVL